MNLDSILNRVVAAIVYALYLTGAILVLGRESTSSYVAVKIKPIYDMFLQHFQLNQNESVVSGFFMMALASLIIFPFISNKRTHDD